MIWRTKTNVKIIDDGRNLFNPFFVLFSLGVTLNFSFLGLKPSNIALKKNGAKASPVKLNHVDQNNVTLNELFKYFLKINACKRMLHNNPESNNVTLIPIMTEISGQNKGLNSGVDINSKTLKQRKLM